MEFKGNVFTTFPFFHFRIIKNDFDLILNIVIILEHSRSTLIQNDRMQLAFTLIKQMNPIHLFELILQ